MLINNFLVFSLYSAPLIASRSQQLVAFYPFFHVLNIFREMKQLHFLFNEAQFPMKHYRSDKFGTCDNWHIIWMSCTPQTHIARLSSFKVNEKYVNIMYVGSIPHK